MGAAKAVRGCGSFGDWELRGLCKLWELCKVCELSELWKLDELWELWKTRRVRQGSRHMKQD